MLQGMKLRGHLGGLNLRLEDGDGVQEVVAELTSRARVLREAVTVEWSGDIDAGLVAAAVAAIEAAGGRVLTLRAVAPPPPEEAPAQTVIVPGNVRSGFRGDYPGSVLVLGDVNPGAELVAGGDVIVLGTLRGMAHAGSGGNEQAIVWARPIATTQVRIAGAVARAPEGSSLPSMRAVAGDAEVARLTEDGILIGPFHGPLHP